jgi:hypothetical protein
MHDRNFVSNRKQTSKSIVEQNSTTHGMVRPMLTRDVLVFGFLSVAFLGCGDISAHRFAGPPQGAATETREEALVASEARYQDIEAQELLLIWNGFQLRERSFTDDQGATLKDLNIHAFYRSGNEKKMQILALSRYVEICRGFVATYQPILDDLNEPLSEKVTAAKLRAERGAELLAQLKFQYESDETLNNNLIAQWQKEKANKARH